MKANMPLQVGEKAPEFTLKETPDRTASLSDFEGRPVVLVFYPADFSPVCSDELALYNEILPEIQNLGAEVLGISVDNIWSHMAFAKDRHLSFPILSDFHPKGDVSTRYHAYEEKEGVSERALYVIDKEGVIAWSYIAPIGVNPGADGVLKALEDLDQRQRQSEA